MAEHPMVDSDVDMRDPRQRAELKPAVLAAIALGGALGGLARHGIAVAFPTKTFPWATFGVNISGCLLIGVLMVLITRRWPKARLLRPFAGVGFLGGFTTFSTYVLDIRNAVAAGRPEVAILYLAGTLVAALLAVWVGMAIATRMQR
ncbi:MAG TPA: CrcB family protein [Candidatus Limnocylindrales bacterium]|nr:CrcB family protein [Candidatus Limnocylindrales bacterium]